VTLSHRRVLWYSFQALYNQKFNRLIYERAYSIDACSIRYVVLA